MSVNPQRLHPRAAARTRIRAMQARRAAAADEVAEIPHVARSTVSNYARRGVLPSIKLGRHRRFVRSDVVHAIERLRQQSRSRSI
jgi:excisionase family DNA binding protein